MSPVNRFIGRVTSSRGGRARPALQRAAARLTGQPTHPAGPTSIGLPVEDVLRADYVGRPYVPPAPKGPKDSLAIAWVIPMPTAGGGGQTTISRFVQHQIRSGHQVTFYLPDAPFPGVRRRFARRILRESFSTDVDVLSLQDFRGADAVIATFWTTAYAVFNLDTDAHKFYFVQDFEPYFYEVGSQYVLAENTYRMGLHGITAGRWLAKKLSAYGMTADPFEFGADLELYRPEVNVPRPKRICFYARPCTSRRAFELGILALNLVKSQRPEIEIVLFGGDLSDHPVPFPHTDLGQLPTTQLASLYQESIACLVLSLTNVSLLPLELLAAGCIPVVNEGENNSDVLQGVDAIRYSGASPAELAAALIGVVDSYLDDPVLAERASASVVERSWEPSYREVEKILVRTVTGVEAEPGATG